MSEARIDSGTRIGHVHLKVADLERALGFYCGVLGFELTLRFGNSAAFVSAGGYHHHIGLNTWESAGGSAPAPGTTGLYHLAIVYPSQAALGDALQRLTKAGVPLDGAADHGVSEALYLRDPDGNGVELYWDRPREEWPKNAAGELTMFTKPLNLQVLLASADGVGSQIWNAELNIGHKEGADSFERGQMMHSHPSQMREGWAPNHYWPYKSRAPGMA